MGNKAFQTFTANGSWTAPAGVTAVKVTCIRTPVATTSSNSLGNPGNGSVSNGSSVFGTQFVNKAMVDSFGNIYSWGLNTNGQLGDSSVTARSSPVQVVGSLLWTDCAPASASLGGVSFGINNLGNLYGWGANQAGMLGDGTTVPKSSPVLIVGGLKWWRLGGNAADGSGFILSSAAITVNNDLYTWGENDAGVLGQNVAGGTNSVSSPVAVVGGLKWQQVIVGYNGNVGTGAYMMGLTTGGVAYGWGRNTGQGGGGSTFLGLGTNTNAAYSSPILVAGSLTFASLATVGGTQSGLTTAGALYMWGENGFTAASKGNLGNGTATTGTTFGSPVQVLGGLTFKNYSLGGQSNSFGITTAGDLYAWGLNTSGQLGTGGVSNTSSPVLVVGGLKWTSIASDGLSVWGVTTAGDMYAWGQNINGQLGDGTTTARSSPVLVVGSLKWLGTGGSDGEVSAYGIASTGDIYVWGKNSNGGGDGTNTPRSSPVLVVGGLKANIKPVQTFPVVVTVTPGTVYTLTFSTQNLATIGASGFAATTVGTGQFTSLLLEYDQ